MIWRIVASIKKILTEDNCRFECKLRKVIQFCSCVPWFLVSEGETGQMCDVLGNKCYEQRMLTAQIDYKNDCGCYTGCNDIRYIPLLDGGAQGPEEVSKPDMLKLFKM